VVEEVAVQRAMNLPRVDTGKVRATWIWREKRRVGGDE